MGEETVYVNQKEAWEKLVMAVIIQAVDDYRNWQKENLRDVRNRRKIKAVEEFFRNDCNGFSSYFDVSGTDILDRLMQETGNETEQTA